MVEKELEFVDYLLNKMNSERLIEDEYRALQYFLIKNAFFKRYNYPVCETFMEGDRALIISDTHIGSVYENRSFIDAAYNYAIGSGINTVIHTGDLIEGQCRFWNRSENELENEINYAISIIPKEVKTKLLFGNHDFSAFSAWGYVRLLDLFFNNPNLDILGLGRIILNWNNQPISLNHYVSDKMVHFNEPVNNEFVVVEGHAHLYSIDLLNRVIKVPSLSDELKDGDYYSQRDLAHFGYTFVPQRKPYVNFLQATFLDNDILLFDDIMVNDNGGVYSKEKTQINIKTKEMRVYKC